MEITYPTVVSTEATSIGPSTSSRYFNPSMQAQAAQDRTSSKSSDDFIQSSRNSNQTNPSMRQYAVVLLLDSLIRSTPNSRHGLFHRKWTASRIISSSHLKSFMVGSLKSVGGSALSAHQGPRISLQPLYRSQGHQARQSSCRPGLLLENHRF